MFTNVPGALRARGDWECLGQEPHVAGFECYRLLVEFEVHDQFESTTRDGLLRSRIAMPHSGEEEVESPQVKRQKGWPAGSIMTRTVSWGWKSAREAPA